MQQYLLAEWGFADTELRTIGHERKNNRKTTEKVGTKSVVIRLGAEKLCAYAQRP